HRDDPPSGHTLDHQAFGEQLRQRPRQAPPALVLEAMDRRLGGTLVRDRGPEPGQRGHPGAAPALPAPRLDLHPTAPAQRFLEAPDPGPACVAEPRAGPAASAAARGYQDV